MTQTDFSPLDAHGVGSQNIIKQKINNGDTLTSDDVGALITELQRNVQSPAVDKMAIEVRQTLLTASDREVALTGEVLKEVMKEFMPEDRVPPALSTNPVKRKAFEETKKIIDNFREKTANYPKYISYEGSMVLCVMLSMKDVASVHISNLPQVDQDVIKGLFVGAPNKCVTNFSVKFDNDKDFILLDFYAHNDFTVKMLNSVAHPRPEDLKDVGEVVPIENDGDRIAVGGKIIMDKRNIQRLGGIVTGDHKPEMDVELAPKRQPVSGRNAFEIRTDIMQMALDWSVANNKTGMSPADVVNVAKVFYSFVENRR